MASILLVDDHEDFGNHFVEIVTKLGHDCMYSRCLGEANQIIDSACFDIVFLDVSLPDGNGLDFISRVLNTSCKPEVAVISASGDTESASRALRAGAWDYLLKPIKFRELQTFIERTLRLRDSKNLLRSKAQFDRGSIVGNSPLLEHCLDQMALAAQSDANVLIIGETGTGKELFAQAIHENSPRSKEEFIVVDCTNLPRTLAESLLFGHEKGSFTGAHEAREGLFKQANGGAIFLDEIGDLDLDIQKSFLRVLQEKRFRPISSKKEIASDFRVIAATNRDREHMIAQGQFRSDLYYRLRTHTICLPPLRERISDIPLLVEHYLDRIHRSHPGVRKRVSKDYMDVLMRYEWPGNVRELVNVIQSSVQNAMTEEVLNPYHFPIEIRMATLSRKMERASCDKDGCRNFESMIPLPGKGEPLPSFKEVRNAAIQSLERMYLEELYSACSGSIEKACKISKLSRARLYEILQKHNFSLKRK
ncbi:sigma-54-dependent transcriptional regulator [Alkalidesulfovibrio alkalitolerans]|nr:sigma-54 dependent transcriptional regulator [Alkalidesulfovibrio alkalitolerans]